MAGVKRLANLLELSRRMGVDGVMILPGANMRYLLDFTIEVFERPAFLLAGFGLKPALVVPRLDENRAVEAVGEFCEVVSYGDETGPWNLTEQLVSGLSGVLG
ncbi:MAG: aminopeptidase P family N-terminal domain-containing protein, partial [Candidatus Caldarchaeum sp.]